MTRALTGACVPQRLPGEPAERRSLAQQLELFERLIYAFSIEACRTHQPGYGLPVLGYDHLLTCGYSVERLERCVFASKAPTIIIAGPIISWII